MSPSLHDRMFGMARLDPCGPRTAGSLVTLRLVFTAGAYGIDDGGALKVATRVASDWGPPQFGRPADQGYVSVSTSARATLNARFDRKGFIRPWKPCVVIDVSDGFIAPGEEIILTYGDSSQGSPGIRIQTFCEEAFELRVLVDPFGTGEFKRLDTSPTFQVIAGEAKRLVVVAPSTLVPGDPNRFLVKVEDCWGNVANDYRGIVRLRAMGNLGGFPAQVTFDGSAQGCLWVEGLRVLSTGSHRIEAEDREKGLLARSNPIVGLEDPTAPRLFWGDIHGQTGETIGTGSIPRYFEFARYVAGLDICAHCANDFQVTREVWQELRQTVRRCYDPGRFVAFLGYEWSGNTSAGGDHNVYFPGDSGPLHRSSHAQISDQGDVEQDRYPISQLYAALRGTNTMVIPHIGGRRASLEFHDQTLEPLIEIASVHGIFEWFLWEALDKGLRVGFICGSDDHTGRPGASYPTFGYFNRGGLIGVYASALERGAVWDAMRRRCCYGTTGERIVVWFEAAGTAMGGETTSSGAVALAGRVYGTGPLDLVEVYRGRDLVYSHPVRPAPAANSRRIRVMWEGARSTLRNKRTIWDGRLVVTGSAIRSAAPIAFQRPDSGVSRNGPGEVRWRCATFGNRAGILVDLEGEGDTHLAIETPPAVLQAWLHDLARGAVSVDAGGVGQRLWMELVSTVEPAREAMFSASDLPPLPGTYAYFLRVIQTDDGRAWTSPVFIDYRPTAEP